MKKKRETKGGNVPFEQRTCDSEIMGAGQEVSPPQVTASVPHRTVDPSGSDYPP